MTGLTHSQKGVLWVILFSVWLSGWGCKGSSREKATDIVTSDGSQDTVSPSRIMPGVGVRIDGKTMNLGDTYASMRQKWGVPEKLRDMGLLGIRFEYGELHISGFVSGPGDEATLSALFLEAPFEGRTDGGVGIGSEQNSIEVSLGTPFRDSFLDARVYPLKGIAFELKGGRVERIHIFLPEAHQTP
jgi:hypothetical protein